MTLEELCNTDPHISLLNQRIELLNRDLDAALEHQRQEGRNLGTARLRYHNAVQKRLSIQRSIGRVRSTIRQRKNTLKRQYDISPPLGPEDVAAFQQEHGTLGNPPSHEPHTN